MPRYVMPDARRAARQAAAGDLHASLQAARCATRLLLQRPRAPRDLQLLRTVLAALRDADAAASRLERG